MLTARPDIEAALAHPAGAAFHVLDLLAADSIAEAGLGPYADPTDLITALGGRFVGEEDPLALGGGLAAYERGTVRFIWMPGPQLWGTHAHLGLGLMLLHAQGYQAAPTEGARLAALIVSPALDEVSRAAEHALQRYAAPWLIAGAQSYRRRQALYAVHWDHIDGEVAVPAGGATASG